MTLPSADVAARWAEGNDRPLVGSAWGVPLVRDGRVLRTAGGGSTPGVLLDPGQPPFTRDQAPPGVTTLVLHDVVDLDGALDTVRASLPNAQALLRYECEACHFGDDPEAFAQEHLSTKRRKRLRSDGRKLDALGEVSARWLEPDEAAAVWDRYHGLLADRAVETERWDATVGGGDDVAMMWDALGGRELLINALMIDDVPVSFRTGFAVGHRFVGYAPIVDRDVPKVSLGDVHMRMLIDQLAERGITTYLMGKGDNQHKSTWATDDYRICSVVVALQDSLVARVVTAKEVARQRLRRQITERGWEHRLRLILHRWALLTDADYRAALRRRQQMPSRTPGVEDDAG